MNEEMIVLEKQLKDMAEIFSAKEGETFRIKDGETLSILQRRMNESDLFKALFSYNDIFAKAEKTSIDDICKSAAAYICLKVLIENKSENFNREITGLLIKEFNNHITKVENVIRLSRINLLSEDSVEREKIKVTLAKNEALQKAFQKEVEEYEALLENMTDSQVDEDDPDEVKKDEPEREIKKPEKKVKEKKQPKPKKVKEEKETAKETARSSERTSIFGSMFSGRKTQVQLDEKLKEEEKKQSMTLCEEIPYYDKTLGFNQCMTCKDIPAYSIMQKKNQYFFGMTKNIKRNSYDNADGSLLELTKVTEDFIQFMTEDILSEEVVLKSFNSDEKYSLQMYFSFICGCFEKNIGITLTVNEYVKFKEYFNRVVLTMFELEAKNMDEYYKALMITDRYITYMKCYNLSICDEKEVIVQNIMDGKVRSYSDDLAMILEHHIAYGKAKDELTSLMEYLDSFENVEETYDDMKMSEEEAFISAIEEVKSNAGKFNDMDVISGEDVGYIQLKIQFQNEQYEVLDEATFITDNIRQAVYDYVNRDAYIKKIGFRMNDKDVYVFAIVDGDMSKRVLTEDIKCKKKIADGLIGQLVNMYEEKLEKAINEIQ